MTAIVAIPVHDEAERIADCLRALAWQRDSRTHEILLLLNNCTDATEAVVRELAPTLPVPVHSHIVHFPPELASAGHARATAMRLAAERAGPAGVLLTTDADGRVAPDWIARNLAAIRDGAEAVCGRAVIDPVDAALIPAHLHEDDALEVAYGALLDQIDWLVDPDPADPWPRHDEHSGASIAVTWAAWHRAGGVPDVPAGEDRAFVEALRRVDAVVRHAPEVSVIVSGRIDGRAKGGMAETIRRRIVRQDEYLDDRLEPASDRLRRATLRARFRAAWRGASSPAGLAAALLVPTAALAEGLAEPFCGAGWQRLERQSKLLRRAQVRRDRLGTQMAHALAILRRRQPCDAAPTGAVAIVEAA